MHDGRNVEFGERVRERSAVAYVRLDERHRLTGEPA
jgi:hypothetical protein